MRHDDIRAQSEPAQIPGVVTGTGSGVALITGCSTGIGRATATTLASAGYRVVATARHPETLDGLEVALTLRLDVSDAASIDAAVEVVLQRYGRIDVLVNNAGFALRGAIEEVDVEAAGRMFDVNVLGIIRMAQAVVPIMRRQGLGRIVNVGSLAGKLGGPANGTYAATKHAVEALSDALRWELAPFGVQVILVEPGAIGTSFEETVQRSSGAVISRPDSPYTPLYARVTAANDRIRASQPGPEAVAAVILTALRAERPHARYPAAVPFLARITMALPDVVKDLVVRRLYGLDSLRQTSAARVEGPRGHDGRVGTVPTRRLSSKPSVPREIAARVYWLPIHGSNVYFVRSGGSWVLIDTAWANSSRTIRQAAESVFGPDARPAAILLTHGHPDHAGAASELARVWGLPLHLHPDELPFVTGTTLYPMPFDDLLARVMPKQMLASFVSHGRLGDAAHAFDPADAIPGLPDWECVPTPGHSPGHAAFFRRRDRVLIVGDAVFTVNLATLGGLLWHQQSLAGPPAFVTCSMPAARHSIATLAELEPLVLASGHGVPMTGDSVARDLRAFAEHVAGPTAEERA